MGAPRRAVFPLTLLLGLACARGGSAPPPTSELAAPADAPATSEEDKYQANQGAPAPAPAAEGPRSPRRQDRSGGKGGRDIGAAKEVAAGDVPEEPGGDTVRDWFPEAFLWMPLVETDDDGRATVEAKVPDSLTTWRVLALAHDRGGQQAGALHTFATRLPVYAEPAVPAWLHTGDVLEMPVRIGNGTDRSAAAAVRVAASGALSGGGAGPIALQAGGVTRRSFALRAERGGAGEVRAAVSSGGEAVDEVVRTVRVWPTGTPVEVTGAGALGADAELALAGTGGGDEELTVTVWPGAPAVVLAELERLSSGGRSGLPGIGLALAARAEASTPDADPKLLRRVRLLAWQEIARAVGTLDVGQAVALLRAVGADQAVGGLEAARPALVARVLAGQRPDGTWSSAPTSTLPRVLAETVTAALALPPDATAARLRASGALERHAPAVEDPYVAAMLLGSGLMDGGAAELLLPKVRAAIAHDDAGTPSVAVPPGAVDAAGAPPSPTEVLAWTVLALPADDPDRGPLAASLLASWSPARGFGAGRGDPVVVEALVAAIPGVATPTRISLWVDGAEVAAAEVDPARPREPAALGASLPSPDASIALKTEPAAPGLSWSAVRRGFVPLDPSAAVPGLEVAVKPAAPLRAGEPGALVLAVSAPSGAALTLEQGLPAGARVDEDAVRALPGVLSAEVTFDRVRLALAPSEGRAVELRLPVTPAFAGRFSTVPLRVTVDRRAPVDLAPWTWTVGG